MQANLCRTVLFVLVAMILWATPVLAEDYVLTLERPRAVGEVYTFTTEGNRNTLMKQVVNDQPVGEERRAVVGRLVGEAEVLEVNEAGKVIHAALTIKEYEGKVNDSAVVIEQGRRIILQVREGASVASYEKGDALSAEANEILEVLTSFMIETEEDEHTDDELFKLTEARSPGQSWQCNNELLAKSFSDTSEFVLSPDQVESEFRFLEVGEVFDQEAAKFEVDVTMKSFQAPALTQQGFTLTRSGGTMRMSGMLPIDKTSTDGRISMTMSIQMVAGINLPDGQGRAVIDFKLDGTVQSEFSRKD